MFMHHMVSSILMNSFPGPHQESYKCQNLKCYISASRITWFFLVQVSDLLMVYDIRSQMWKGPLLLSPCWLLLTLKFFKQKLFRYINTSLCSSIRGLHLIPSAKYVIFVKDHYCSSYCFPQSDMLHWKDFCWMLCVWKMVDKEPFRSGIKLTTVFFREERIQKIYYNDILLLLDKIVVSHLI